METENKRFTHTENEDKQKTAPNGMAVYDFNEPWVQQYIKDFGVEPSFF